MNTEIVLTPREQKTHKKIQDDIHYCLNCQARDNGDWIWVMGERSDIESLFDDYNVNEIRRNKFVKYGLHCNYCGTSIDRYDEIGLEDSYEKEISIHVKKANQKYGKQINELKSEIKNFPTLAYKLPLAKSIYKEIENKTLPICSVEGTFFRARKVDSPDVLN